MHADEITITLQTATTLVAQHCPQWRDMPITPVLSTGTDHTMFRLGEDMALRFPKRPSSVAQVEKEHVFLPLMARRLSWPIPSPVAAMPATTAFPYPWSVCKWIEGEVLAATADLDEIALATDLARFLSQLHALELPDLPSPGSHNFGRGVPLQQRDGVTRQAIQEVADAFDTDALITSWETCLAAKPYRDPPVPIHGDLVPSNVLMRGARLASIIDWGGLAQGDPACDLIVAWHFLTPPSTDVVRDLVNCDDDEWLRGLGWALSVAALQLPYYKHTNPPLAANARATLTKILDAACYDW
jgi:aminoglycoside phosphotransferase (APT) family kinase protein